MLRKRRKRDSSLAICAALLLSLPVPLFAQEQPPVPQQYGGYFFKYKDQRSVPEKLLNIVGMTNEDVGRSFALLCGISEYPNMSSANGHLPAAAEDIRKLKEYLEQNEFFDEIVVLENEQVTTGNLEYFLQAYFADRLKKFPKSRFLFAYSGHGMTENNTGYLLKSTARNLHDRQRAIKVDVLKNYIDEVVRTGHHVLVLLNSCYSGTFLRRSFGSKSLLPQYPGAHAITAGGSGEATWHDGKLGPGSVFYEKVLAGLHGKADRAFGDNEPDGIITAHELGSYLIDEIRLFSEQKQNPQMGDITQDGSDGEFFFLNRNRNAPLIQHDVVTFLDETTSMDSSVEEPNFQFSESVKMDVRTFLDGTPVENSEKEIRADLSESKPHEPWMEPITDMEFVYIPKGCFQMGSPSSENGREDDEGPVHEVCVNGFWMGKYEVTQKQWKQIMGENPAQFQKGDNYPVEQVSWEDTQKFIVELNKRTMKKYRLPTEAEWEYAARAGTETAYFWGDSPDDACRYANVYDQTSKKKNGFSWTHHNCDDGYAVTAPVDSFPANAFGLHNMLGNVWEWCSDWYDSNYYKISPDKNPTGPSSKPYRAYHVLRGGSWDYGVKGTRSAYRFWRVPDTRSLGFRLVLPVQQGR